MGFRDNMMKQFSKPKGLLGKLAGIIMAKRASNIERNLWGISMLNVQPDNIILEIGCGPGIAVEAIAAHLTTGKIVALDYSDVMISMAKRKNKASIMTGKVEFIQSDIAQYTAPSSSFDRIFSSNVVQFWDDPVAVYKKIKEMLKPDGRVVTNYMARQKNATTEDTLKFGRQIEEYSHKAGFKDVEIKILDIKPVAACCVIAKI